MRAERRTRHGRRARRGTEGMTLVEIMVVVIIMTLIASAVGVAVFRQKQKADENLTRTETATIAGAVEYWRSEHGSECPTVARLVDDGALNRQLSTTDAWQHDFVIACTDSDSSVTSAGRDGRLGTEDDITPRRHR